MDRISLISLQTADAYQWVNKLIDPIPIEKWQAHPDGIESSIAWQVGHLIISTYYHSIIVIVGHLPHILNTIDMKSYRDTYHNSSNPRDSLGAHDAARLQKDLLLIQKESIAILSGLNDKELDQPLEESKFPHPVASTKFEALDWNIKHTMWHCGQIGMIKRAVDQRYDFFRGKHDQES